MRPRPFFILAVLLFLALSPPTFGQLWDKAAQTAKRAAPAVVSVQADIEIDLGEIADMMGMEESVMKSSQFASGLIIHANGGVVVPTSAIEAPALPAFGGQGGGPEAVRVGLKVHLASGQSFDAKEVARDKKLGLTYLQIETKETGRVRAIDMRGKAALALGTELLALDRLPKEYGFATRTTKIRIAGQIKKPAAAFLQQGAMAPGSAVFSSQGGFIGLILELPSQKEVPDNPLGGINPPQAPVMVLVEAESIRASLPKSMDSKSQDFGSAKKISDPAFLVADKDKNGTLSGDEFQAYARSRLTGRKDKFYQDLFALVDTDHNKMLSVPEFAGRMSAVRSVQNNDPRNRPRSSNKADNPTSPQRRSPTKRDLNDKEGDYDKAARRAAPRDAFPVFDNPKMSKAKDAKTKPSEAVIGVVCDGEARAYPISIMGVHELGNDVCGKTPIAVSW